MTNESFRIVLAVLGLTAFLALLGASIYLVIRGQTGWAAFTGGGAIVVALNGLYGLLASLNT